MPKGGVPVFTACARCLHGKNVHKGGCLKCGCDHFWGGRCFTCSGWCFRGGGQCYACYKEDAARKQRGAKAYLESPEYRANKERKEQMGWLKQGRRNLVAVRRRLRNPVA